MNKFNNSVFSYINESIIDITRNSLDPTVFQYPDDSPPIMHPMIKTQIMSDIEEINRIVPVVKYFALGSILTQNYSGMSDIDINVQIKKDKFQDHAEILAKIASINGRLAPGTTHPINYFPIDTEYNLDLTDAAYDVENETWIKEPKNTGVNIKDYMMNYQSKINAVDINISELRRNIIDYETLKSFDVNDIKGLEKLTKEKLTDIENNIEELTRLYTNTINLRKSIFNRRMTPTEIRKYGKKNKLPDNVIYKLLEKYYYLDFLRALKKYQSDDKITDTEIKNIKKLGKRFWQ